MTSTISLEYFLFIAFSHFCRVFPAYRNFYFLETRGFAAGHFRRFICCNPILPYQRFFLNAPIGKKVKKDWPHRFPFAVSFLSGTLCITPLFGSFFVGTPPSHSLSLLFQNLHLTANPSFIFR